MECIILAGGFGTRLQSVVADVPKCMAPVNEQPFLHYLFDYLAKQGCTKVILSLGYKHEVILKWLAKEQWPFAVDHVIEQEPLGTGGGIQLALQKASDDNIIVLNGDTMFRVNLQELLAYHQNKKATTTLALKPMQQFDRYGTVQLNDTGCIISFDEKKYCDTGLINGGVYVLNKTALTDKNLPEKFSLEQGYFERFVAEGNMYGFVSDTYFIDIGIPVDYQQAQQDFQKS